MTYELQCEALDPWSEEDFIDLYRGEELFATILHEQQMIILYDRHNQSIVKDWVRINGYEHYKMQLA